ncbi:hypothetical protein QCN17_17140, partial [Enterobacter asburiae]
TVCVVGKMRDLILQLSKSSIYSTKPANGTTLFLLFGNECREIHRVAAILVQLPGARDAYRCLYG